MLIPGDSNSNELATLANMRHPHTEREREFPATAINLSMEIMISLAFVHYSSGSQTFKLYPGPTFYSATLLRPT